MDAACMHLVKYTINIRTSRCNSQQGKLSVKFRLINIPVLVAPRGHELCQGRRKVEMPDSQCKGTERKTGTDERTDEASHVASSPAQIS